MTSATADDATSATADDATSATADDATSATRSMTRKRDQRDTRCTTFFSSPLA
ncbi:hypothetical protein [Natrialba magadii]|uniref:hypothetical protein n=1 Tax=Natrialba magadii TaxID=13769 RepID=UPI000B1BC663|nr:hypothetical protein [Natrialba magadii]